MVNRSKFLAAGILMFLSISLLAQEAKVVGRKGDVKIVNGLDIRMASTNMVLTGSERIIMGDDAYLSVVDIDGRTAELNYPGEYDLQTVFTDNKPEDEGTAYRFAGYLLDRMTAEGKKNRLGAVGYFIRSKDTEQEEIRLYIPGAGKYYQDHLELSWENTGVSGTYTVEIFNMYHELLRTVRTSGSSFELIIDEELGAQNILLIQILGETGVKSELYALKRLGSYHREDLTEQLHQLNMVYSKKNAISRFVMAGFFEYHNLLADALTCYLEAIRMAPEVPVYREAYDEFLLRNHLVQL